MRCQTEENSGGGKRAEVGNTGRYGGTVAGASWPFS